MAGALGGMLPTVAEEEVLAEAALSLPSSTSAAAASSRKPATFLVSGAGPGPSRDNMGMSLEELGKILAKDKDFGLSDSTSEDEERTRMMRLRKRGAGVKGRRDPPGGKSPGGIPRDTQSQSDEGHEEGNGLVHKVWRVVHHSRLPEWLKDNEFLVASHRPELRSFKQCLKSVFRIHTETGNIWTHLLGMAAFLGITLYFLTRPSIEVQWQDKVVFGCFFAGAILCLGLSTIFHTVFCHSRRVCKLFNKFDYCGITFLTVGSFIPWLYYGFYCRLVAKIAYLSLIAVLGTGCIVVSLWDKFSDRRFRSIRAGMFVALGLSGVIPAIHVVAVEGFYQAVHDVSLGWLSLMALLYIMGAVIYAVRIPERLIPGKCDIWFQSHQIFHVLVVAAALVHYHGISTLANFRLTSGDCSEVVREV